MPSSSRRSRPTARWPRSKKAKDAGITIICFNTCVSEPGIASGFLVTKNEDLGSTTGAAAAKFITEKLGGKAVVGMLNCDQFEGCPPRKEGFMAEMAKLPGVEIVADQAGWIADDALPVAEAMLQANPDDQPALGCQRRRHRRPMPWPSSPPAWRARSSSSAPT